MISNNFFADKNKTSTSLHWNNKHTLEKTAFRTPNKLAKA